MKKPRYLVPDDGTLINLLDRLRNKWLAELSTVPNLTPEDLTCLDDLSREFGCYTCFWSSYGTCGFQDNAEYMIPDHCPLPHGDLSMEEIFSDDPGLCC